ncbi:MAG: ABC transporter ATP-binding protein, partial [Gammaproteobacteria bacterium]|nr:ABC transporter ATP-binding protein [Gammaproteobacteria bacterium]
MIARALVHEPRLLILDEPTAGVDIELRRSMWEFLSEINKAGTTIILTTHYLEEAEHLCRNIAIIDEGDIIENTSMKNLLTQLDSQVFILDLVNELFEVPEDTPEGVTLHRIDSHCLEMDVEGSRDIGEIFSYLSDRGIQVTSMRNKTNRLEQLFLAKLRDE